MHGLVRVSTLLPRGHAISCRLPRRVCCACFQSGPSGFYVLKIHIHPRTEKGAERQRALINSLIAMDEDVIGRLYSMATSCLRSNKQLGSNGLGCRWTAAFDGNELSAL